MPNAKQHTYDVIVVGAGHAGIEAALATARLGLRTLIVTVSIDHVALLPCNPSIGGPAKAHLVREVDALGGAMGEVADACQIQMRMLNTAKGPAVHSLRAQMDKDLYRRTMTQRLENTPNLYLKELICESLIIEDGRASGIIDHTGSAYRARAVILATGTYLNGAVIIGEYSRPSGPNGQVAPQQLSASLKELGFPMLRFKTGTPPRVDKRTVDFSQMIVQAGDDEPRWFSHWHHVDNGLPGVPCHLTYTAPDTHKVIRDNLHRSPMATGLVTATAPRYCPSIEDKIVRFSDKSRHQLFIEPEGLETNELYIQGFATSLPMEVQEDMVRSLPGLEKAEIMRPGYAIEYDLIDPTALEPTLETKALPGLYCAGQINGSSGYEEAAAQGIMAGINAGRALRGEEPVVLRRHEAYIGVLIDDLVTKGTNEPYRMLTSRSEYRLLLRQDNANLRLTPLGREIGLIDDEKWAAYVAEVDAVEAELLRLRETTVPVNDERLATLLTERGSDPIRQGIPASELLKRPEICYADLVDLGYGDSALPTEVTNEVAISIKYAGYISKQKQQVARVEKLENKHLPPDINYHDIRGLRIEARQKLDNIRPHTVGQASRISGVNPADVSVLLVYLEQRRREGGQA